MRMRMAGARPRWTRASPPPRRPTSRRGTSRTRRRRAARPPTSSPHPSLAVALDPSSGAAWRIPLVVAERCSRPRHPTFVTGRVTGATDCATGGDVGAPEEVAAVEDAHAGGTPSIRAARRISLRGCWDEGGGVSPARTPPAGTSARRRTSPRSSGAGTASSGRGGGWRWRRERQRWRWREC